MNELPRTTIKLKRELQGFSKQAGLTLVELMIAIILGLLVSAAALAIFLGAQRSLNMQNGMSSIQQSSIFGLTQLTHYVRHANLNTTLDQKITPTAIGAGIVMGASNFSAGATTVATTNFFSANNAHQSVVGNVNDNLVIQFMPEYQKNTNADGTVDFKSNYYNCEGDEIKFESKIAGSKYVTVHRFFVAKMPDAQQNTAQNRYALYCDYAYYESNPDITSPDDVGVNEKGAQMLIADVDAFKVRVGVKNNAGNIRYMSLADYNTSVDTRAVSLELGILVRSGDTVGTDSMIDAQKQYMVAGTQVSVQNASNNEPKYLREAYSQVVALRNAQGGN